MPQFNFNELKSGKKYRLSIRANAVDGLQINFPVIDINVPFAPSKSDINNLVPSPPTFSSNGINSFSKTISPDVFKPNILFNELHTLTYSTGTASTTKVKATYSKSSMVVHAKVGNYDGSASYWQQIPVGINGTCSVTYSGSADGKTAYKFMGINKSDNALKFVLNMTASVTGKFAGKNSGIVKANVPFRIKSVGPIFSPIRNITKATKFDGGATMNTKLTFIVGEERVYTGATTRCNFKLSGDFYKKFTNTTKVKDVVIPIWRYQDSKSVVSKWYYCGVKDGVYFIPSTASNLSGTYIVNTSQYYELESVPRSTIKKYTGFDNDISNLTTTFGQPTASATDENIVSNSTNLFGMNLSTSVDIYFGFSDKQKYPIREWHLAFVVARYKKINDVWTPVSWINASDDKTVLNISKISILSEALKNQKVLSGKDFRDPIVIKFNSEGKQ